MNKPILGIFREHRNIEEFVFKAAHYQEAYEQIIDKLHERGIYVALLMGQKTYQGNGKFSKHWVQIKQGGKTVFEKRGPITVDAVYDKDHFVTDGKVLQVNNPELYKVCWSKEKTYELLGDFHPKTLQANTPQELSSYITAMPGDRVALKDLTGSSGDGVFVGSKSDALKTSLKLPLIVQEFIETSAGVPGITKKRHDVRVVLANGRPIAGTLRTPPEGGFKSNIGYGGENRLLSLTDLPADLLKLCQLIDARLKDYGKFRLYSIDFGLTPNGWRMFEANGMPGVIAQSRGPQALPYQEELADFLAQVARVGQSHKE